MPTLPETQFNLTWNPAGLIALEGAYFSVNHNSSSQSWSPKTVDANLGELSYCSTTRQVVTKRLSLDPYQKSAFGACFFDLHSTQTIEIALAHGVTTISTTVGDISEIVRKALENQWFFYEINEVELSLGLKTTAPRYVGDNEYVDSALIGTIEERAVPTNYEIKARPILQCENLCNIACRVIQNGVGSRARQQIIRRSHPKENFE